MEETFYPKKISEDEYKKLIKEKPEYAINRLDGLIKKIEYAMEKA